MQSDERKSWLDGDELQVYADIKSLHTMTPEVDGEGVLVGGQCQNIHTNH